MLSSYSPWTQSIGRDVATVRNPLKDSEMRLEGHKEAGIAIVGKFATLQMKFTTTRANF
jgi:hypothetical protein